MNMNCSFKIFIFIASLSYFLPICANENLESSESDYLMLAEEIQEPENCEEDEDVVADRERNSFRDRDQRNLYETNRDNLRREARERARKNRYNKKYQNAPEGYSPSE